MASLQFVGALENLSDRQVQFIREQLEKQGFENNKVIFEPASKAGDNFVANVLRITVIVDGGDDVKIIAKIAPQLEILRKTMNTSLMFSNEIIIYKEVLPRFNNLQIEAGVPENERLKYAKCYGYFAEEPNEVILLEDLKPLDYVILDRLTSLNDEAVLLVLKNFAILHSMSFVLKHLDQENYESFKRRLFNVWSVVTNSEEHKAYMTQVENKALEVLDDEQYKKCIRGVVSQTHTFAAKTKKDENSKYLVIQQGDAWTNNIMFKVNGDKPVDAIMIDYQQSCETSPVADIFYFIYNCTNHDIRSKNYYRWINYYHEQLDKSLSNFGLKATSIYPKHQLDADLHSYSMHYFGVVVMMYGIFSMNPEEAAEMHNALTNFDEAKLEGMQAGSLSKDTVTKYRCNLQDIVDSYRQFGYID